MNKFSDAKQVKVTKILNIEATASGGGTRRGGISYKFEYAYNFEGNTLAIAQQRITPKAPTEFWKSRYIRKSKELNQMPVRSDASLTLMIHLMLY